MPFLRFPLLRSLAFNLAFPLWTAVLLIAGVWLLALPRAVATCYVAFWARGVLGLARVLCGLRFEVRGERPAGPVIVAAKHQSAWDTIVLNLLLPWPAFVIKKELGWLPIFGWFLRHQKMILIDRGGGAAALRQLLAEARAALDAGRALIIFPEGTRTRPGEQRPYRSGIAALYEKLDTPVVPVALNSGSFWGRRSFIKRPGRIVIEFLPPIPPGLARRPFLHTLSARIESASQRLLDETAPPA